MTTEELNLQTLYWGLTRYLPDSYAARVAIAKMLGSVPDETYLLPTLEHTLDLLSVPPMGCFLWDFTPEGWDFWEEVFEKLDQKAIAAGMHRYQYRTKQLQRSEAMRMIQFDIGDSS